MKVTFNAINNLGTVSTFQTQQSKQPFNIEANEIDAKQAKVEASRENMQNLYNLVMPFIRSNTHSTYG